MSIFKKAISMLLAVLMIFGAAAAGICNLNVADIGIKAEAVNYKVGDIIEFGSYPQSEVTDSSLLKSLNSRTLNWISYDYYSGDGNNLGTSEPADTMKYADVTYKTEKYRAVRFSEYRAAYTTAPSGYAGTPQKTNGYLTNTVYWFKYEPVEWRVLDPEKGLIMCETIIDSQAFVNTPYWSDDNGDGDFSADEIYGDFLCTYLHYNYPHSSLKEWLNSKFYNTAFSSAEKNKITDNSYSYPGYALGYAPDFPTETVTEKIFLLSVEDMINSNYGFDSTAQTGVNDETRIAYGTDYAKCQGLMQENEAGYYFLRSSWESNEDGAGVFSISNDGKITNTTPAQCTGIGIRPAIVLNLNEEDTYDLGDETYSFENFTDNDSNGHCFGMSMTSSGYHTGELDITAIGGSEENDLYTLSLTNKVKSPICYYQKIQKEYSKNAIVAGGVNYKNSLKWDIASDWNEVVNYVKNHSHDGKGDLQIGFRKKSVNGGHAVNFLRYEEVNGQARIYAYDNNFPDTETYFYMNSNGNVLQYPKSTFSGAIDCIALRSVSKYFDLVVDYDATRYLYAKKDSIAIEGVEAYLMDGNTETGCTVMFEVPSDAKQITIIPLVDNAEFEYLDDEYSFGNINDDTVGVFKLVSADDAASGAGKADFTIVNGGSAVAPEVTAEIRKPSVTTINYGDSIVLHANVTNLPSGGYVEWTASNGNFSYVVSKDGTTCTITPETSGDTTFTATVYDSNGKVIDSDEQVMTAKAGLFQKIIAFFKKLFGMTKVISQFYEE